MEKVARLSRSERAAANRAALLEAAEAVFLQHGYHGTTVDAIALEAGFTIGALYSRFGGKADVYLALLEQRIETRAAQFSGVEPIERWEEIPFEFARRWCDIMRAERDWTLLSIEFRVHAARDAELNTRYAALHERAVEALTDNVASALARDLDVSRSSVRRLCQVALAVSTGVALARSVEGDAFSDDLYLELSRALGGQFLEGGHDATRR